MIDPTRKIDCSCKTASFLSGSGTSIRSRSRITAESSPTCRRRQGSARTSVRMITTGTETLVRPRPGNTRQKTGKHRRRKGDERELEECGARAGGHSLHHFAALAEHAMLDKIQPELLVFGRDPDPIHRRQVHGGQQEQTARGGPRNECNDRKHLQAEQLPAAAVEQTDLALDAVAVVGVGEEPNADHAPGPRAQMHADGLHGVVELDVTRVPVEEGAGGGAEERSREPDDGGFPGPNPGTARRDGDEGGEESCGDDLDADVAVVHAEGVRERGEKAEGACGREQALGWDEVGG
eukprot:632109-Rhodomonas_salina.1